MPEDELLPTRASLLDRLQDWNDHSSWQAFFDLYWKLIYGLARKAGLTDAEAQDVVQETMSSVAKHMPTFRYDPAIGSFKAWLRKLTGWRIGSQFRKRDRHLVPAGEMDLATDAPDALQNMADPSAEALDAQWESDWAKTMMKAALDRVKRTLEPEKYQIFDFYVNKEWPPTKVAKAFGISVNQVYLVKHRVALMLKKEILRLEKEMI
jgi:RNA polymerase sigma factor (sigma-70 family)